MDSRAGVDAESVLRGQGRAAGEKAGTGRVGALLRFALRNPVAVVAALLLLAFGLAAIFAWVVAPYDPLFAAPVLRLQGSNSAHWLGTDSAGRDVLSRLLFGARASLGVGLATTLASAVLGTLIGLICGYAGGIVDMIVQRVTDAVQCFPALILAMLVISLTGSGQVKIVLPMTLIFLPSFVRTVRASVLTTKSSDYVIAATTTGARPVRVVLGHILPNVVAPILVIASLTFGYAILVEATLSFLGLGTQPPSPSWGGMLAGDGRRFLGPHPFLVTYPALAISLTVLAVNIIGDSLRDALDPSLRGFS